MNAVEKIFEKVSGAKLDMIKSLGKTISESAKSSLEGVKDYGSVLSGSKAKKSLEALKKGRSGKNKYNLLSEAKKYRQLTEGARKAVLSYGGAAGVGAVGGLGLKSMFGKKD